MNIHPWDAGLEKTGLYSRIVKVVDPEGLSQSGFLDRMP